MDGSIYKFTKQKLCTHGVTKNNESQILLTDQKLFLLFVKLERARRLNCFDTVQFSVSQIERYLIEIEKRHLIIFAYAYLYFTDGSPNVIERDQKLDNGYIRRSLVFRKKVTETEVIIAAWGGLKYQQNSYYCFKIIYGET